MLNQIEKEKIIYNDYDGGHFLRVINGEDKLKYNNGLKVSYDLFGKRHTYSKYCNTNFKTRIRELVEKDDFYLWTLNDAETEYIFVDWHIQDFINEVLFEDKEFIKLLGGDEKVEVLCNEDKYK